MIRNAERREKLSYDEKVMGAEETIFAHYRMKYLADCIMNNGVLLDVGCGAGRKIQIINANFAHLVTVGLDISGDALTYAHKNNPKPHFIKCDAEKLPVRNKSADYIVSFDLLEHLHNPKEAMKEFHRISKRGGTFHSFIPCEGEKFSIVVNSRIFRSLSMKHAGHIQHFTKRQIRSALEDVGFSIVDEKHSYSHIAQIVHLLSYMFSNVSEPRLKRTESKLLRLIRSFMRVLISPVDLRFSNMLPNHSMGYHVTARKNPDDSFAMAD